MALAEREVVGADATQEALDYLNTLIAEGMPRSDAARATADWCRERGIVMDLVDTVLVAGFNALAHSTSHHARERYERAAHAEKARPERLVTLEPASALTAAEALVSQRACVDYLEIPYVCEGVEIALGDMTRDQIRSVRAMYLSQAKGKLRHVALLGAVEKIVPAGRRVRDVVDREELGHIVRDYLTTDNLAELWMGIGDAAYAMR